MNPRLRFPEFAGYWERGRLGDFFTFKNGVNADKSMYGRGRKFINVMDVISDAPITLDAIIGSVELSESEFNKNKVVYGDMLFQRSSETREEVGQSNIYVDERPATFGGFVIRGRPKRDVDPYFFHALLKTAKVRKDMTSRSGGSTRYNIGQESLEAVEVCVAPTRAEQQKIAAFLGAVSERVALLRRRRAALERYKKGALQRMFAGTIRFKRDDGTNFPDWEEKPLADVLSEHGERGNGTERVHSVSVHKGIVDQVEHLGRRFAAANTESYNLVKPGDVVYTKSPTGDFPFGIIKQSRLAVNVIVSPLYGVFTPETSALGYIINDYFSSATNAHNYLHQLVQKGAKNTINITNKGFLRGKLRLPHDPSEQRKIADFLSALDEKIGAVAAEIDAMQAFKKGLLQQMFV